MTVSTSPDRGLSVRDAVRLEAAIHGDAFMQDLDALLRARQATLLLGWHGKWAELAVQFAGDAEPRIFLRQCRKWQFPRAVATDPLAVDFYDRLRRVLDLHGADIGLGLCEGGVAKCQVVMPNAPREREDDPAFALRLLITSKGRCDVRAVDQESRQAAGATHG